MKIKTTMRYHFTAVRKLSPKNQQTSVDEDVETRGPLFTVDRIVIWCSHRGKQYRGSSKN